MEGPRHGSPAGDPYADQSAALRQGRKAQNSSLHKSSQKKYFFPVKQILLTRDPKDRSISGNGLGMKVVGGKVIPGSNGVLGAYVAKVYAGGVVETLGEVNEGDQVLEWNGVPLTGKTYEEVQRIIASSTDEVEVVIRSDFNMLEGGRRTPRPGGLAPSKPARSSRAPDYDRGLDASPDDSSEAPPGALSPGCGVPQSGSPLPRDSLAPTLSKCSKLQACYDIKAAILYVTIVQARRLATARDSGDLPDPFVTCFLLPRRTLETQRRSRCVPRCSSPVWKQTMVYPEVPPDELKRSFLQVSVWNSHLAGCDEFLGEVVIHLSDSGVLDEQSHWYKLHMHDESRYPRSGVPGFGSPGIGKMARINAGPKIGCSDSTEEFRKGVLVVGNQNRRNRVPIFPTSNLTAHPLLPRGCQGAVCNLF
ncbi:unnamed protein product [Ixodes persulcatus]